MALQISRELISQKLNGQAAIVRDLLDASSAADAILRFMIPALSAYIGQVSLGSTYRYLNLTPERFRGQLDKLSPRRSKRHWRDNPALMKFLAHL